MGKLGRRKKRGIIWAVMKAALYRTLAILIAILGGAILAIALTGDKSWESISLGIALIAIGIGYEHLGTIAISDFKLNVINEKIEFLGTQLGAIQTLLSMEEKLSRMKADINKIEAKSAKDKRKSK